jgi:acetyltransferase-like isoleucine patch superfamily enzyme
MALRGLHARIDRSAVLYSGSTYLYPWLLTIGHQTNIGYRVHLDARGGLTIGSNCNISSESAIWTQEHDVQSPDFVTTSSSVCIEDRVWVCFRAIIMPGVTLGEGCVVASGAIVTKDVAPFTIVAGIPAREIGRRNTELRYELGRL